MVLQKSLLLVFVLGLSVIYLLFLFILHLQRTQPPQSLEKQIMFRLDKLPSLTSDALASEDSVRMRRIAAAIQDAIQCALFQDSQHQALRQLNFSIESVGGCVYLCVLYLCVYVCCVLCCVCVCVLRIGKIQKVCVLLFVHDVPLFEYFNFSVCKKCTGQSLQGQSPRLCILELVWQPQDREFCLLCLFVNPFRRF